MTVTTAPNLGAEMAAAGFVAGPPPWLRAECLAADLDFCRDSDCPACGRRGLEYRPFHRPDGRGQYLAFGLCACGAATEV